MSTSRFDFQNAVTEWSNPPWTGLGYISSEKMLQASPEDVLTSFHIAELARYSLCDPAWKRAMGYDTTTGKTIIDFGCGTGIEGIQFARRGNKIIAADISKPNLAITKRMFDLLGMPDRLVETVLVSGDYPFFDINTRADLFIAVGSIQASPRMGDILRRVAELGIPECRLWLHSDKAWTCVFGEPLPSDTTSHPEFERFVRLYDSVGKYLDWYSREKLQTMVKDSWNVVDWQDIYLSEEKKVLRHAIARLERIQ